eukprot:1863105-Amphidinium_carterae.1
MFVNGAGVLLSAVGRRSNSRARVLCPRQGALLCAASGVPNIQHGEWMTQAGFGVRAHFKTILKWRTEG